jgi:pimeloyl-ACP methyl ester carboxylesterase
MRTKQIILRIVCPAFAVVLTTGFVLLHTVDFQMNEKEIRSFYEGKSFQPQHRYVSNGIHLVHYVVVGDERRNPVLFVPGSPGTWDNFISFTGDSELLSRARIISVDRPGMGDSEPREAEPSIARQSEALLAVLQRESPSLPAIAVGHSLGGAVAARMAMDAPDRISSLILIAASIDPDLESPRWYNRLANLQIVEWALPRSLVLSNREIMPLKSELEAMAPLWVGIRVPVTVIHGGRDRLVHPGNAEFAKRVLPSSTTTMVRPPGTGHLIPWTDPQLIRDALLEHLDQAETRKTR